MLPDRSTRRLLLSIAVLLSNSTRSALLAQGGDPGDTPEQSHIVGELLADPPLPPDTRVRLVVYGGGEYSARPGSDWTPSRVVELSVGRFEVELTRRRVWLEFSAEGRASAFRVVPRLPPGQRYDLGEVRMTPGATLEGRLLCVRALGDIRHPDREAELLRLLLDPQAPVRAETVTALAGAASPEVQGAIRSATQDQDAAVRAAAASALGQMLSTSPPDSIQATEPGYVGEGGNR